MSGYRVPQQLDFALHRLGTWIKACLAGITDQAGKRWVLQVPGVIQEHRQLVEFAFLGGCLQRFSGNGQPGFTSRQGTQRAGADKACVKPLRLAAGWGCTGRRIHCAFFAG